MTVPSEARFGLNFGGEFPADKLEQVQGYLAGLTLLGTVKFEFAERFDVSPSVLVELFDDPKYPGRKRPMVTDNSLRDFAHTLDDGRTTAPKALQQHWGWEHQREGCTCPLSGYNRAIRLESFLKLGELSDEEILAINGIGPKILKFVRQALDQLGRDLAGTLFFGDNLAE